MPKKEMTFEEAVLQLEQVVEQMENENLTLDESVDLYKQGVELSNLCKKKLEEAQEKIRIITEEDEKK